MLRLPAVERSNLKLSAPALLWTVRTFKTTQVSTGMSATLVAKFGITDVQLPFARFDDMPIVQEQAIRSGKAWRFLT
ncbi:hypothetical protein SAMN05446635_9946 [Burkholderia sp. OK233]|nr:hypothetical protein SAMN05446635_9946 [Burkholderia sp. OK233]